MTILVTGGAGYIGSHTILALLEAGHDVVAVDNFVNAQPEALRRVRRLAGRDFAAHDLDLRDRAGLTAIFAAQPIDAVIHFAALKAVGESGEKPLEYYANNLGGLLVLIDVMRSHACRRMVFSSSATVYGVAPPPFREDAPLDAINPYGRTKLYAEQILRDVAAPDPRWRVALLRYFNPVGAHPSGAIGESPQGVPNNLFPYVERVAVGTLPELRVFGNNYATPDGTGVRDYLHVCDLAAGHIAALGALDRLAGAEAINLGSGQGHSVLEVVRAFEAASGRKVPYRIVPPRPGDVAVSLADPTKANALLGWRTQRTLVDMCADSWRWQSANPGGYADDRPT